MKKITTNHNQQQVLKIARELKIYINKIFISQSKGIHPILKISILLQVLDCLGAYYSGRKPGSDTFSDFCSSYLTGAFGQNCRTKLTFKKVYELFRNRLVHNAIFGGPISIDKSQVIWKDEGKLFIDATRLLESVENAFISYFNDLEENKDNLLKKFYKWHVKVTNELIESGKYLFVLSN